VIRLADYVAKKIADFGVKHVFMVTGGGAMHLNDAIGHEPRLTYVCNHHEQACAIAAEGYARVKDSLAVVCVTTGPGSTNTITGVLGEWLDSLPVLYISGQVRYDVTVKSSDLPLRQLGDQEANIIEIVKPITKFAEMVIDPQKIRIYLEKAVYLATNGRPGPVWLDIPLNVQAAQIDETKLDGFTPPVKNFDSETLLTQQVSIILQKIAKAQRPLILGGAGIRLAHAVKEFRILCDRMSIPVQDAWDAIDVFPSDNDLYAGRPSTLGQRGANFIFQNADLILSIGCRLNLRQIGYEKKSIARAAYKIVVDIDPVELKKPTIDIDLPICSDAGDFIDEMLQQLGKNVQYSKPNWLNWCHDRLLKNQLVIPEVNKSSEKINPYIFSFKLSEQLKRDEIIVSSNGSSCVIPIQVMKITSDQRHIVNSGCAAMGYGLPAAIGACFANNKERVICLEGDGSIQMNIQEFETLVYHQLPVKMFIFNNSGYLSIRTTQENYFNSYFVGESQSSGVGFPDFVKLANAYGINALQIEDPSDIEEKINQVLLSDGPFICNVKMDPEQKFMPRIASKKLENGQMISSPLEDMFPFLCEEELKSNMIIPLWNPKG
jgi:acetolactate synthase I/II/III large subunit